MSSFGWAISENGTILPETVQRERRGAIVNWLFAHRHERLTNAHTDAQIENLWEHHTKGWHPPTEVIEVEIRPK